MPSKHTTIINITSTHPLTVEETTDVLDGFGPHVRQAFVTYRDFVDAPEGQKVIDRAQAGVPEPQVTTDQIRTPVVTIDEVVTPVKLEINEPD